MTSPSPILIPSLEHREKYGMKKLEFAVLVLCVCGMLGSALTLAQTETRQGVDAIKAPATPLPNEAASGHIKKFSFIAYGDTRGRRDGVAIQYEHSLLIDSMLARIKKLAGTDFPVKFVLQSGDAVQNGREVKQWNVSFVPLINRLTTEGGVPYFLTPGNHEATTTPEGMRNYLDAVSALLPLEASSASIHSPQS